MTAPRSLRELFDQIGLREVESSDDSLTMEMPRRRTRRQLRGRASGRPDRDDGGCDGRATGRADHALRQRHRDPDLFNRYLRPIKIGPARAVARILRTGRRSVVVQVDIYRANDDEIGATVTVNFAAVGQD